MMVSMRTDEALWTVERGRPCTENGDIVTVIATTEKVVQSAYVNGVQVEADHTYVTELMRDWAHTDSAGATVFDKALTPDRIRAHHAAYRS